MDFRFPFSPFQAFAICGDTRYDIYIYTPLSSKVKLKLYNWNCDPQVAQIGRKSWKVCRTDETFNCGSAEGLMAWLALVGAWMLKKRRGGP